MVGLTGWFWNFRGRSGGRRLVAVEGGWRRLSDVSNGRYRWPRATSRAFFITCAETSTPFVKSRKHQPRQSPEPHREPLKALVGIILRLRGHIIEEPPYLLTTVCPPQCHAARFVRLVRSAGGVRTLDEGDELDGHVREGVPEGGSRLERRGKTRATSTSSSGLSTAARPTPTGRRGRVPADLGDHRGHE